MRWTAPVVAVAAVLAIAVLVVMACGIGGNGGGSSGSGGGDNGGGAGLPPHPLQTFHNSSNSLCLETHFSQKFKNLKKFITWKLLVQEHSSFHQKV